jgi:hypothetical protein
MAEILRGGRQNRHRRRMRKSSGSAGLTHSSGAAFHTQLCSESPSPPVPSPRCGEGGHGGVRHSAASCLAHANANTNADVALDSRMRRTGIGPSGRIGRIEFRILRAQGGAAEHRLRSVRCALDPDPREPSIYRMRPRAHRLGAVAPGPMGRCPTPHAC